LKQALGSQNNMNLNHTGVDFTRYITLLSALQKTGHCTKNEANDLLADLPDSEIKILKHFTHFIDQLTNEEADDWMDEFPAPVDVNSHNHEIALYASLNAYINHKLNKVEVFNTYVEKALLFNEISTCLWVELQIWKAYHLLVLHPVEAYSCYVHALKKIEANNYKGSALHKIQIYQNLSALYSYMEDWELCQKYMALALAEDKNGEYEDTYPLLALNYALVQWQQKLISIEHIFDEVDKALNKAINANSKLQILQCRTIWCWLAIVLLTKDFDKYESQLIKKIEDNLKLIEKEINTSNSASTAYYYYAELNLLYAKKQYQDFLKKLNINLEKLSSQPYITLFTTVINNAINIAIDAQNPNEIKKWLAAKDTYLEKIKKTKQDSKIAQIELAVEVRVKEAEIAWYKELNEANERLNESLLNKNRELESFASTAAHDLKSPIRTIKLFSNILFKNEKLSNEQTEGVDFINKASKQMESLVGDLLNYATSGKHTGEPVPCSIADVLEVVKANLRAEISAKDTKVQVNGNLLTFKGHFTSFVQLFQNLIGNAIKFSKDGVEPVIAIRTEISSSKAQLIIEDNGLGIAQDIADKIFEPLYRVHQENNIPGSGIGLATCKKIVENYGGEISVQSEIGIGSIFKISLPVAMLVHPQ